MGKNRYTYVKERAGSIGRRCLRCKQSATVTAIRVREGRRMPVWYCPQHWDSVRAG